LAARPVFRSVSAGVLPFLPSSHCPCPWASGGAHLGRPVNKAKKSSGHSPSSGQCKQQQACGSPAPTAGFGLHLGTRCCEWGRFRDQGGGLLRERAEEQGEG
jgi:hypothetical protein